MSLLRPRSLKWRLVGRLAALQATTLTLLVLLILLVAGILWRSGVLDDGYEGSTLDTLRDAIERDAGGNLALRTTPELANLRSEFSDLWLSSATRRDGVYPKARCQRISGRSPTPSTTSATRGSDGPSEKRFPPQDLSNGSIPRPEGSRS